MIKLHRCVRLHHTGLDTGQVLHDQERVILKTQLARMSYDVLGKGLLDGGAGNDVTSAEIFDDCDFYHTLLRDLSKSSLPSMMQLILLTS